MPEIKEMSGSTGWFKHQPGAVVSHADGSKWRKHPDNTWKQVTDKSGAKIAPMAKKINTYQHGQVASISGKHYMKVADNRYSPVQQSKGGTWTHDSTRHGIQIHKNSNGKTSFSKFKPLGHEVMRATMKGEEKVKSDLHSEHKITNTMLQTQKKSLIKSPVTSPQHLQAGHIVRVQPGKTMGKEDHKKEGIVGKVKRIAGGVAHIVNDVGRSFEVPLHSLAMAKSKSDGLIHLRRHPKATLIMLKALRRND